MTLTRLALAWALVAAWFLIATVGTARVLGIGVGVGVGTSAGAPPDPTREAQWVGMPRRLLAWRLIEAVLLTLLGSLWFESLGSGEWWLIFLLVGALTAIPAWLGAPSRHTLPGPAPLVGVCADLARYLLAGSILAWQLG